MKTFREYLRESENKEINEGKSDVYLENIIKLCKPFLSDYIMKISGASNNTEYSMYNNNDKRIKILHTIFTELNKIDFPKNDIKVLEDNMGDIEIKVKNDEIRFLSGDVSEKVHSELVKIYKKIPFINN